MGNSPSIGLKLLGENAAKNIKPGTPIRCKLFINSPSNYKAFPSSLYIRIKEQISWTEIVYVSNGKSVTPVTSRYYRKHLLFEGVPQYWWYKKNIGIIGDNSGVYILPNKEIVSPEISLSIPDNIKLPPSYQYDSYNYIKYQIVTCTPIPSWGGLNKNMMTYTDLNGKRSVEQRDQLLSSSKKVKSEKDKKLLLSNKKIRTKISMKDSTWIMGKTYPIKIKINNPERIAYKGIKIELIENHSDTHRDDNKVLYNNYYTYQQMISENMISVKYLNTIGKHNYDHGLSLYENEYKLKVYLRDKFLVDDNYHLNEKIKINLPISDNISPSFRSNFFTVSHVLRVTFFFPMFYGNQVIEMNPTIVSN